MSRRQARVVISQSMLFPWVGMLEQVALADVFVHYNDVAFSKGSLVNRVQVKVDEGSRWMTVPLSGFRLGQRISDLRVSQDRDWRRRCITLLERSFRESPHRVDALAMAERVLLADHERLAPFARESLMALAEYFDLVQGTDFLDSAEFGVPGSGSSRVLDIVRAVGGSVYVTGHGARHYLDHETFEAFGIDVQYMEYRLTHYSQPFGPFTPFVTGLDLVANEGPRGRRFIRSGAITWKAWGLESE